MNGWTKHPAVDRWYYRNRSIPRTVVVVERRSLAWHITWRHDGRPEGREHVAASLHDAMAWTEAWAVGRLHTVESLAVEAR